MAYRGCPVQLPQNKCVRVLMANLVNEALCSHSVNHMCQNAQSTTPFQQQPVKIRINKQYHNFAYFSSFFRTFSFGRLLVMKEKNKKKLTSVCSTFGESEMTTEHNRKSMNTTDKV